MKKHPVATYFFLTFLFSWAFWSMPNFMQWGLYPDHPIKSIYGIGVAGPILAATALSLTFGGCKGLKELYARFSLKHVKAVWYLIPLLMPFAVCLTTLLAEGVLSGKPLGLLAQYDPVTALSALPFLLVFATMEEVGWRGYALPKLRARFESIPAAMLLGLVWGVWHLPKLLSEGTTDIPSLLMFEAGAIVFSLFISWIYENSRGSVNIAVLAHASLNASIAGAPMFKVVYNRLTIVYLAALLLCMAVVFILYGAKLRVKRLIAVQYVDS